MIPAWLLSPRLWASLALSAAVCGMVWWLDDNGFARGKAAVQVKFDEYKVKQEAAYNKLISDNEVKSQKLKGEADAQRTMDAAAIAMGNTRYDALAASLRNRPGRPATNTAGMPTGAGLGTGGCTGAGLARPDGEFLAWYAISTYRLQTALRSCKAQYDKVKRSYNGE